MYDYEFAEWAFGAFVSVLLYSQRGVMAFSFWRRGGGGETWRKIGISMRTSEKERKTERERRESGRIDLNRHS